MKLILSQYLHTLKERNEFDLLLPDLLLAMGYVPLSHPQTGTREYGVDLAVVGKNPEDDIEELVLLVIKRGDLGRADWDSGPQSVRQSLNDVLDVYLKTHIEPAHTPLRKKIILTTTGNLKRDTQLNWNGYIDDNATKAIFEFWGGDKIAVLMEKYMLDEHIFTSEDRILLRKSLALAADADYDQSHLYKLFLKTLSLNSEGQLVNKKLKKREVIKSLRQVNLLSQIYAHWAEDEGNLKQALIATEKALLWSWHRINLESSSTVQKYYEEISYLFRSYLSVTQRYFHKLEKHMYVRNGFSGWSRESSELSIVVFEQIGLIASIGLSQIFTAKADNEALKQALVNAEVVANGLINCIENNPVSGSPAFDSHSIDITLALLLLVNTGKTDYAKEWLKSLIYRADFTFKSRQNFPICTDSQDDLVEFIVFGGNKITDKLIKTSWLLPTLAAWAVLLECDDSYAVISTHSKEDYSGVCLQFWHPTTDLKDILYFRPAHYQNGEAEAPIFLPGACSEYKDQMSKLLANSRYDVLKESPAFTAGIYALDLIACRHFRTPIPPFVWYQLGGLKREEGDS